jgi:hypothetical protein
MNSLIRYVVVNWLIDVYAIGRWVAQCKIYIQNQRFIFISGLHKQKKVYKMISKKETQIIRLQ